MDGLTARDLSRLVLAKDWTATAPPPVDLAQLEAAYLELTNPASLIAEDPGLTGEAARRIDKLLRPIGAKIDPRISDEQAFAWRSAVILALSDLPARVVEYATRKAVHRPMQFLNEVETIVREIAVEATEKQRVAAARLRYWKETIERATNEQKRLEAPETHKWTQADVDQANESFGRIGIKTRYRLVGDDVESYQASAEERESERTENSQN